MEQQLMIWIASFTGKSMFFDTIVMLFLSTDLLKGAPFAFAILLAWVTPFEKSDENHRVYALRMFLVVILSVMAARISQGFITSPRPIMVKEIADHFSEFAKSFKLDWNSFPSDHMCLYFPIALMTYFKNKKFGKFLIIWSLLGVGFPRIFFGRHYPTDVLGGMAVGSLVMAIIWSLKNHIDPILNKIVKVADGFPNTALAFVFLFCFQIATVFDNARWIAISFKNIFNNYFGA